MLKKFYVGVLTAVLMAGTISPALTPTRSQAPLTPEPTQPAEPPVSQTLEPQPNDPSVELIETPAPIETEPTVSDVPILPDSAPLQAPAPINALESANATSTFYLPLAIHQLPGGAWTPGAGWPTVAANPARTSWSADQVAGQMSVRWYRPIEAYISQNVQLIASDGVILVSTARGLYALNPATGATVWRFDTELPLGNSPTVADGIVYVGGHDRKIHALDVRNGTHLWAYAGAGAGYDTNPLVVGGRVFAGNRDGYMYAIGAHGTPQQGQLLWRYKTGGPIHLSAAYRSGAIFFASNDNRAYALSAEDGGLLWRSPKLPGDGFHSYWPVVYGDKVIFSGSHGYRVGVSPGLNDATDPQNNQYGSYTLLQRKDIFPNDSSGILIGPSLSPQGWSKGFPVLDASRITEYYENRPDNDPYKHKPWRRTSIILNVTSGSEYTFDSDRDGYQEYAPISYWGTNSGNRYPPIVSPDNTLYFNSILNSISDAQGVVMSWNEGTQFVARVGGQAAVAEPMAISGGGGVIYRNLCCDRVASLFGAVSGTVHNGDLWSYNLYQRAPTYDDMWTIYEGLPRYQGFYKGNTSSINGIYHNHGDQNPVIPYGNLLFTHRSNAIIAFGVGGSLGKQPLLRIESASSTSDPISAVELRSRLEDEVTKIIDAGHLRPGYYTHGTFVYRELADYFENPGDTLYTLSIAYPHLSSDLQSRVRTYLQNEWLAYFYPTMYADIGWAEGAARESMPLPPEVQAKLGNYPKSQFSGGFSWFYPQHNFYAMWKYVANVAPNLAGQAYDQAKTKLQVPLPDMPTSTWLRERPFELNAYIAGYYGFLRLQEAANRTSQDAALRTQVQNELNRLYALRVSIFSKDTPYLTNNYHKRSLNIARNFIFLVPELGDYLNQNDLSRWRTAVNEYDYVAPYWFVTRYEAMVNEGVMSNLYNAPAMFQAKAYVLKQSRAALTKYLDAPAFERGDLFYIQNLIAALNAP